MIDSLKFLENNGLDSLELLERGQYYRSVPPELEDTLVDTFEIYKKGMTNASNS